MKLYSFLLTLCSAMASTCLAATVTIDGAGIRGLREPDSGSLVRAGSNVWVGYFLGLTDADIVFNQHNASYLQSKFVSFGLGGTVGVGVGGADGYFTFDTTATVEAPGASFTSPSTPNNKQIYVWAFNSASAPLSATHQAIFTSTGANWLWPVSDDGSTDRTISPDNSLSILVGSSDSNGVYLQAMPEPGPSILFVVSAIGFMGMRRGTNRLRSGFAA